MNPWGTKRQDAFPCARTPNTRLSDRGRIGLPEDELASTRAFCSGERPASLADTHRRKVCRKSFQDLRNAEQSRSDPLGAGMCAERAWLEANACMFSVAGTAESEVRVNWEILQGLRN